MDSGQPRYLEMYDGSPSTPPTIQTDSLSRFSTARPLSVFAMLELK